MLLRRGARRREEYAEEERCAKVDRWQNSNQRLRWLATALIDIEPRLRRVRGHRHLGLLREALKRELKIGDKSR